MQRTRRTETPRKGQQRRSALDLEILITFLQTLGEEAGRRQAVRGQPKDNVASASWNWTGGGQGMRDDGDQTSGERSTVEANPNGSFWNWNK